MNVLILEKSVQSLFQSFFAAICDVWNKWKSEFQEPGFVFYPFNNRHRFFSTENIIKILERVAESFCRVKEFFYAFFFLRKLIDQFFLPLIRIIRKKVVKTIALVSSNTRLRKCMRMIISENIK